MDQFLAGLAEQYDLVLEQGDAGWLLRLPERCGFVCKLDVGPDALEWYAFVNDAGDGREVWRDWMDYLGYGEPEPECVVRKRGDISWFVKAWNRAADMRVTWTPRESFGLQFRDAIGVEWNLDGEWRPIEPCDA